jgi:hypothetical protein
VVFSIVLSFFFLLPILSRVESYRHRSFVRSFERFCCLKSVLCAGGLFFLCALRVLGFLCRTRLVLQIEAERSQQRRKKEKKGERGVVVVNA